MKRKKKINVGPPTEELVTALATKTMEYFGNPKFLKIEKFDDLVANYDLPTDTDLREMMSIIGGVVIWDHALFHIGQLDEKLLSMDFRGRFAEFKYDMWAEYLGKLLSHLLTCVWKYEYEGRFVYLQLEGHLMIIPREIIETRVKFPEQYSIANAVNYLISVASILKSGNEATCDTKVFYRPITVEARERTDGFKGVQLFHVAADANVLAAQSIPIFNQEGEEVGQGVAPAAPC